MSFNLGVLIFVLDFSLELIMCEERRLKECWMNKEKSSRKVRQVNVDKLSRDFSRKKI